MLSLAQKLRLRAAAARTWARYCRKQKLRKRERELLRRAYYAHVLPRDSRFDLYQWVEDGLPYILM